MVSAETDAVRVVRDFVARINDRDVAGLTELMTDDHRFVDATGAVHAGRDLMRKGWEEYFSSFPDYHIEVEDVIGAGPLVALFGWARGTARGLGASSGAAWRIPAAWRAEVRERGLAEWRVYCDVEPMLRSLGINRFPSEGPQ